MMLHGEHLAGAREAGLHLVGDQQDAMLVADLAQRRHEVARRLVEAAFALHRLDDDGGHARRVDVGLEQPVERGQRVGHRDAVQLDGEGRMEDVAGHRPEAGLVGLHLAGQCHAHEGAAVEAAGEGDHRLAPGGVARDLDRVLDRFGTGGDEDGLLVEITRRDGVQPLGQVHVVLVRHDLVAGVGEAVELRLHRFHHSGVAMAGVDHRDAAREIDIAAAFDVPDFGILGAVGIDLRRHADAARDRLVLALGQGGVLHDLVLRWGGCCHMDCGASSGRNSSLAQAGSRRQRLGLKQGLS